MFVYRRYFQTQSGAAATAHVVVAAFKNRSGVVFWLRATKLLLFCFFGGFFFSLLTLDFFFFSVQFLLPSGLLLNLNISGAESFCL